MVARHLAVMREAGLINGFLGLQAQAYCVERFCQGVETLRKQATWQQPDRHRDQETGGA